MKTNRRILFLLIAVVLLSACSLQQGVATLYKQQTPLESDIIIPASLSTDKEETIKVMLTQGGEKIEDPDYVYVEIWKQGGTVKYEMEQVKKEGKGIYSVSKKFEDEGLYYIKVHARNNDSIIMPKKQFIVGELSQSDVQVLKKGIETEKKHSEAHH